MTAASLETSIREAVEARVASLPMAGTYPVKWVDGPSYDPSASTPYIRAAFFPNSTARLILKGTGPHRRLSLLQLDFMAKKTWTGKQALQVAGQIAEHFPAGLALDFNGVRSRVTAAPRVAAPMVGDAFIQVPIQVRIETFA